MHQIDLPIKANSILDRWKQELVAGNQCFIAKDFNSAERRYELARQCAEKMFKDWLNSSDAVSALVVTYHNIADLQRKMGNGDGIFFYLEKVHKTILNALLATSINDQRHGSLIGASKQTYAALVSHKKCGVYV